MNWDEITDWFDKFYAEYVEGKKLVRGRAFSGGRIEIYGKDDISIVLNIPYLRGETEEEKAAEIIRTKFDKDSQSVHAEFDYERFKKIVSGEQPLAEEDWFWHDEFK